MVPSGRQQQRFSHVSQKRREPLEFSLNYRKVRDIAEGAFGFVQQAKVVGEGRCESCAAIVSSCKLAAGVASARAYVQGNHRHFPWLEAMQAPIQPLPYKFCADL